LHGWCPKTPERSGWVVLETLGRINIKEEKITCLDVARDACANLQLPDNGKHNQQTYTPLPPFHVANGEWAQQMPA